MTSLSDKASELTPKELAAFGIARARDIAFDAVSALWRIRASQGMKQFDLARAIGRDPAWVSRALRGPGNWRMQTLGELVGGLNGVLEIKVYPREQSPHSRDNYSAYEDHELRKPARPPQGWQDSSQSFGAPPNLGAPIDR